TYGSDRMEAPLVSGIAFNRNEASLTILGVPDQPTVAAQILNPISDDNIDVDMIVQNSLGDGTADFTFTVNRDDYRRARALLEETAYGLGAASVQGNGEIAKVSIVGVGMWNHPGVARTMFKVLGEEGINMQLISTSEIKISVVIDEKYLELAVRALHAAFGLDQAPLEQPLGNNL
ncbi:MAG: ACT domain-containing protein, partial [Aeromonas sp.]